MTVCPTCHQLVNRQRLGVQLSPVKARIVDLIQASGRSGISSAQLSAEVYPPRVRRSSKTMRMHVAGINEALAKTEWLIVPVPARGRTARWYLWRRAAEAAE